MKKKSPRSIPDFSRHPTPLQAAPGHGGVHAGGHVPLPPSEKAAPPAPRPIVKPHATSAKSGRRGQ